jgi:integrase
MALNLAQIKAVLNYELTTDIEKRSRDLWYFSYLCNGININDLCRLKHKDISGGEIHFLRQKTIRTTKNQKTIAATLLPQMIDIIKKWGTKEKKPDSYIFPFLSSGLNPKTEKMIIQNCTRLINKKMAAISKALNYDNISTYTARHSYATVLKRSGANIAFISESLGHSDLRTTENYLASFEQEERAKNALKLTEF